MEKNTEKTIVISKRDVIAYGLTLAIYAVALIATQYYGYNLQKKCETAEKKIMALETAVMVDAAQYDKIIENILSDACKKESAANQKIENYTKDVTELHARVADLSVDISSADSRLAVMAEFIDNISKEKETLEESIIVAQSSKPVSTVIQENPSILSALMEKTKSWLKN